jgi:hypothetical protein
VSPELGTGVQQGLFITWRLHSYDTYLILKIEMGHGKPVRPSQCERWLVNQLGRAWKSFSPLPQSPMKDSKTGQTHSNDNRSQSDKSAAFHNFHPLPMEQHSL